MKKGFTLVEVIVAVFIFTLVILAAYQIYDHSQKTYLLGEQLSDVQQGIRFAYEKVSQDLRVTGYRVYPDSEALRPDLPLEGIWPRAIAIRASFTALNDPSAHFTGLECTNKGVPDGLCTSTSVGIYPIVTTQNSDIHIYVLAKKPLGTGVAGSDEQVKFKVDLNGPRTATVSNPANLETIEVTGISLAQTDPPYTLYLVQVPDTLSITNNDTVHSNQMDWTPIAANIVSMQFEYYNQNGISAANIVAADGWDITGGPADPEFRRRHGWPFGSTAGAFAKNVVFRIMGMTARPESGKFVDPILQDPDFLTKYTTEEQAVYIKTKQHRKYDLASTISMTNVGVAPHELADIVPPDPPSLLEAVTGYCNGALLMWLPSNAEDLATYWVQLVEPSLWTAWGSTWKYPCDDAPNTCFATSSAEDFTDHNNKVGSYVPLAGSNGKIYHGRVFAQDAAGNFSHDPSNDVAFTVDPNPLKPDSPGWGDLPAPSPAPPEYIPPAQTGTVDGYQRLIVAWKVPTEYDDTQNAECEVFTVDPGSNEVAGTGADPHFRWLRDLSGYRLYHRRMPTAAAADFTPTADDLVANETTPAGNPLQIPMTSYPDLKACPCERYTYKIASVTACTDAWDDTSKTPPCLHAGLPGFPPFDTSISSYASFEAPYINEDLAAFPQLVPARPASPPTAQSTPVPMSADHYDIKLGFNPVMASEKYDPSATPPYYANTNADLNFEVWKYKIWRYDVDPVTNPTATPTVYESPSGVPKVFDAGVAADTAPDAPLPLLTASSIIYITALDQVVPTGENRWYAVSGVYKCTDATTGVITYFDGQIGPAVQVPCNASFTLAITNPAVDNAAVSGNLPITMAASASIDHIELTITGPSPTITLNISCTGTPNCTTTPAVYVWNTDTVPEGVYMISAKAVDSMGCAVTVQRPVNVNRSCGGLITSVFKTTHNVLNDTVRINFIKPTNTEPCLLDDLGFLSFGSYLYTHVIYWEVAGINTPYLLWLNSTGADLSGTTIGVDATPNFLSGNLCNGSNPRLNLHPILAADSATNRLDIVFDQTLGSSFALYLTFTFRPCDQSTLYQISDVAKTTFGNLDFGLAPVCSYVESNQYPSSPATKLFKVDAAAFNKCTGQGTGAAPDYGGTVACAATGSNTCYMDITFTSPSGASLVCANVYIPIP
jgi:prepilin-type N-terminal cleavage/methylation domain-containing protein